MCVCCEYCVCCQVEVSASGRSLFQGSPTEWVRVCVCVSLSMIRCNSNHLFPQTSYFEAHVLLPLLKIIYICVHSCNWHYWKTNTPIDSFTNWQRNWRRYQRFNSNSSNGVDPFWEDRRLHSIQKCPAFYVTPNFIDVPTINRDSARSIRYKILHFLHQQFILIWYTDCVLSLRTGLQPLLQRFSQTVRSSASSFKFQYRPTFLVIQQLLTSSSLFPLTLFPTVKCFRSQLLFKIWPIQLANCRVFHSNVFLSR